MQSNKFPFKIRLSVFYRNGGRCELQGPGCTNHIQDFHHIVPKEKANQLKYGSDKIHSEENCIGVCRHCHTQSVHLLSEHKTALTDKWGNNGNRD